MDASNNHITELCDSPPYLQNVSFLSLRSNHIHRICDSVLAALEFGNLQILDLSNNSMENLPKKITNLTSLKRLWLGGNPFICDCHRTMWMHKWILTFMTSDQNHVIQDIYDIFCANSPERLVVISMMCPNAWLMVILSKVAISLCALVVAVAIVVLYRKRNEVRWRLYLHFDISFKWDKDINIAEMNYDCYLSYW